MLRIFKMIFSHSPQVQWDKLSDAELTQEKSNITVISNSRKSGWIMTDEDRDKLKEYLTSNKGKIY